MQAGNHATVTARRIRKVTKTRNVRSQSPATTTQNRINLASPANLANQTNRRNQGVQHQSAIRMRREARGTFWRRKKLKKALRLLHHPVLAKRKLRTHSCSQLIWHRRGALRAQASAKDPLLGALAPGAWRQTGFKLRAPFINEIWNSTARIRSRWSAMTAQLWDRIIRSCTALASWMRPLDTDSKH